MLHLDDLLTWYDEGVVQFSGNEDDAIEHARERFDNACNDLWNEFIDTLKTLEDRDDY